MKDLLQVGPHDRQVVTISRHQHLFEVTKQVGQDVGVSAIGVVAFVLLQAVVVLDVGEPLLVFDGVFLIVLVGLVGIPIAVGVGRQV